MNAALTPDARDAICRHMNDDHGDALAAYARCYARVEGVRTARLTALDELAMELAVETAAGPLVTRIAFDHALTGSDDARDTLIAMARHAMADA